MKSEVAATRPVGAFGRSDDTLEDVGLVFGMSDYTFEDLGLAFGRSDDPFEDIGLVTAFTANSTLLAADADPAGQPF